jgi:hypothetical protein
MIGICVLDQKCMAIWQALHLHKQEQNSGKHIFTSSYTSKKTVGKKAAGAKTSTRTVEPNNRKE